MPASSKARTGWVKRPHHTKGLDPLGVQAPCITIYQQLVPGITNVTDRARYYSFYPWLIWAFNQTEEERSEAALVEWIRRGDCLFSMIGIRHRFVSGDEDGQLHDAALVGSRTLRPVVRDLADHEVVSLSDFTIRKEGNPNRYFKNKFGGLGQYYLGTLSEFGIMGRQESEPAYTRRGEALAEAVDEAVNRTTFVETIQEGRITNQRLDDLAGFCPCQLAESEKELSALIDLFFGVDVPGDLESEHRSNTLLLHLDLIREVARSDSEAAYGEDLFRGCAYGGALPDGQQWTVSDGLDDARRGWAVYEKNELLSLALQCVFWVSLREVEVSRPSLRRTDDLGTWFAESDTVTEATRTLGETAFSDALEEARRSLAPLSEVFSPGHEFTLANRLLSVQRDGDVTRSEVLALAGQLLLLTAARSEAVKNPYDPLSFPSDYFDSYPLNLSSFKRHTTEEWHDLTLPEWFGWLASHWGAEAHMRVALRKLHAQSNDTFHIVPTESGLTVLAEPTPTFTTPRFSTTIQILQDLGVIRRNSEGTGASLSELGQSLVVQ